MSLPHFKQNLSPTMGVELELQLVDLQYYNLAMEAKDFLRRLSEISLPGEIKPEITQSMIEINSSVHTSYHSLVNELQIVRNELTKQAAKTHIGICGGGAHPFQKWNVQRIFPTDRFTHVSNHYGYLAKQFTVFGQHIHIGCQNGDDALYLCHALTRYIPQFIALSAASPFHQGVDTAFDCSRLNVVNSFPLSGTVPWLLSWDEFSNYFYNLSNLGIVNSIKDFYWDIRPKPEYGTIELRICDTPLTIYLAAELAAYAQLLVIWLLDNKKELSQDIYLTYSTNRFRATRFGLDALIIDPIERTNLLLAEDIINTCKLLHTYAIKYDYENILENIVISVQKKQNGAKWLRRQCKKFYSLSDTVRCQTEHWAMHSDTILIE